jgi:D-arabinose 1-dehydrogenase-like Zn-dependent alcohol dehydrogenase
MITNSKAQRVAGKDSRPASAELRLKELGITLPSPPEPFGTYAEAVQTGNLLFLTGMLPTGGREAKYIGRVGAELDTEAGRKAARLAALNALAVAREYLGTLDRISRIVRLGVSVANSGDVRDQPKVADGASELLQDVFGKEKNPSRLVYGVASLPLGTPIVLEVIFEVAGIIDELGAGVSSWKLGQRVGVGLHGGHDGTCLSCRRGDFRNCINQKIAGISYDGGYQEYMVALVEGLVAIPDGLDAVEAAPLLCAGITTYNALRHSGALPGDLVAIQGIGGLGHLGNQFANKFGYKVAAIGRGPENATLAKKLGAKLYINSRATNPAEELQKPCGAKVVLATAPSSKAMSAQIDGLGPNGKLVVIGAAFDPIEVTPIQLISGSRTIQGWAAGTPADSEGTLQFAELSGVRPMIETYPLEKAAEAYARMLSSDAQFRVVLTM